MKRLVEFGSVRRRRRKYQKSGFMVIEALRCEGNMNQFIGQFWVPKGRLSTFPKD